VADKSIRAQSATVAAMARDWEMIDALMDGTNAMRDGGTKWLPKWPNEEHESYKQRLSSAVLHPVFKRTVLVMAARPFSRPLAIAEGTSQQVIEWADDVDLQGATLGAFSVRLMVQCLSKGLTGVLVDFPKATDIKTKAAEKKAGVRPYCVQYPTGSLLGWKTEKGVHGLELSQLRLLEQVEIDNGEYGTVTIEQVRVLTRGKWETYRENPNKKDEWLLFEEGPTTLNVIPFVFFYGIRKDFGVGISPLGDLAHQNVEHWQSSSDQQTILHVARVPILFARMFDEGDKLVIGAGSAAQSTNEKAELKYVEHTGAAIGAGQESLNALEDRMRATGAELVSLDPGYATATEVSSDGEATRSLLQQIVENFEESAEEMLDLMALWVGEQSDSELEIYKDFGIATSTDPGTLSSAVSAGSVSKQTHFEELQRRDVISADRTWDDEVKRLAKDAADAVTQAAAQAKATAVAPAG
jgi:hypothetical protein